MDASPFFTFNVLSFSDREVETLRAFTREAYAAATVHELAEEIIFTGKVTGLVGELLRSPSENFVRFLLSEADLVSGRVTARVIERFMPTVRRAIQSTLVDMMTKSLQHEIPESPPTQTTPEPALVHEVRGARRSALRRVARAPRTRVHAGSRVQGRRNQKLQKLRSLVLVSYEEEARRRERGGSDDDEEDAPLT
jgi:hypothetical protein